MNVTIRIDDQLVKRARHQAVDDGLSLSGWIAHVVRKQLSESAGGESGGLLAALGSDDPVGTMRDVEFERDVSRPPTVKLSKS